MKWYDKCFGSLRASSQSVTPVVIDNASTDGSVEYIRTHFPEAQIIPNTENLGFAKANNLGIRYALDNDADYVFLLNQDAWVEKNTIAELLRTFEENENVGIASPIHLNGSYMGLDLGFASYAGPQFTSDVYMNIKQKYYAVDFVNAAAWLISAQCIKKVGGFDTLLFKHYGEDGNFTQRVLFHGMRVIINTECTVCHDREQRKDTPKQSQFNKGDSYYNLKCIKGNILSDFNLSKEVAVRRRELCMAYLGLHFKRIKRLKEEIEVLRMIDISRKKNVLGGEVWLY